MRATSVEVSAELTTACAPARVVRISPALAAPTSHYRFATRKPSRAEAARELLDRALKAFFEVSRAEPVRPGDPDYVVVRARRREPVDPLPIRQIEARLVRLKKARAA